MKKRKKDILNVLLGIGIGCLIMLIFWPKRIAKLENGEEPILETKVGKVTANDLYDKLKTTDGVTTLFNMVDLQMLKDKYPDLENEAKEEAEKQSKEIIESYQNYYGYSEKEFLSSEGFENKDKFIETLVNQYYYQNYYDDYVEDTIKEKEINDYYNDSVFGEKSIYLFSSSEEKNDLESVRSYLKKGKSLKQIQDKYPDVNATSYETVKFTDTDTFSSTILDKIAKTKKGKYTEVFSDSSFGNVVIYVVDEKDKAKYEDIKEDIIKLLVTKKENESETLYYDAFTALRDEYKLTIYDTEIKKIYDDTINSLK